MQLADKFRRPIITFLDTPGAYPGIDAEERGQAEAIALNLREMSRLGVPVITIVIGEGGSGGALGMGIANRVFMLENAYYSVISPGELRGHHLSRFGQSARSSPGPASNRHRSVALGLDRRHYSGTSGRRPGRSGSRRRVHA